MVKISREELDRILARYRRMMFFTALAMVHDPHKADDLVQSASMKAVRLIGNLRELKAIGKWLHSIVVTTALNPANHNQPLALHEDHAANGQQRGPAEEAEVAEQESRLREALTFLEPEELTVLLMHDMESWSYAEIGVRLDLPSTTVRSRVGSARAKVRRLLGPSQP